MVMIMMVMMTRRESNPPLRGPVLFSLVPVENRVRIDAGEEVGLVRPQRTLCDGVVGCPRILAHHLAEHDPADSLGRQISVLAQVLQHLLFLVRIWQFG